MEARIASIATSSRFNSDATSSATICFTTMRGSCSTAWPRPMPSVIGVPESDNGRRLAKSSSEATSDCNSPEAIISASSMAVVWRTSTSSSM